MVLDLTDSKNLVKLGVKADWLVDRTTPHKYNYPQMIGDLAKKRGIEVLKVPSAQRKGGVNYILFK